MRRIKRAIHLDFHNMPNIPDFGANFDARALARTLSNARVDFITVFAKCSIGFAYYPTKIGVMHPHLKFDMLGQITKACQESGIGVAAYFNIGLDHEMARKHRDWCVLNKDGQVIYGDRTLNFFRLMCLNTGYRQYVLSMIREVVETYPIAGIFLDCLVTDPCYGNECNERLIEIGKDPLNDADVARHTKQTVIDFCWEVKRLGGDQLLFMPNGLSHDDRKGMSTHTEIECLPGMWGYDYFSAQAAYARGLGKPAVYMTGRFHAGWGDYGGLKQKASLEYDCWDAISHALSTSVGDHMHPRDGLDSSVYNLVREVYTELEKLEPWTDQAEAVAEIAIVMPPGSDFGANNGTLTFPQGQTVLYAAARMLGELKYTYDIVAIDADLSKYKVVILPDVVPMTDRLMKQLASHLERGGGVISSGYSGLNPEKTGFALPAWNMDYVENDSRNIAFFQAEKPLHGIPADWRCAIYKPCIVLRNKQGAETIASYHQPYFNKHWDGFHGHYYTPPERATGHPALARSKGVFQFSFQLFTGYSEYAVPEYKYLLDYCLKQLWPNPVVKCENIPSTARVNVTKSGNRSMIHVKVTYPELRGRYNVIEDHNELTGGVVLYRTSSVKAVYTAPTREPLSYEQVGEYVRVALPKIRGYIMVVIEH